MQFYQECVALGSKSGLSLVSAASPAYIENLYRVFWKKIFLFEKQFSRFLPSSELSIFNRNAGIKHPTTPEFRDILRAASEMAHTTNGLYNPFILPALQKVGYKGSRVPGYEEDMVDDHSNKSVVAIDRLEIGDNWARIPYGTAIDLGGCGKGYLADQLRDNIPEDITGYWLSFGGDIAVGGYNEHNKPWTVAIQNADDTAESAGVLTISGPYGVATSGTTVIRGTKAERTWHHIIDPRTRQPANTDVLLATVCDSSALRADVLASCAVILGSTQGLQFLKGQGVKSAVLQCNKTGGKSQIKHFGNGIIIGTNHA